MKKAILIVSFGTTYTETRIKNITAIKNQVSMLYPDTIIEEAVSSRIVRNHMKQDEHIDAKSPMEALMSLKEQGATGVVVFPTHVIDGIENNQMKNAVEQCRTFFEKICLLNVDFYLIMFHPVVHLHKVCHDLRTRHQLAVPLHRFLRLQETLQHIPANQLQHRAFRIPEHIRQQL